MGSTRRRSNEIKVRPIRDERDYEAALTEIDAFMDAARGTSAGDRLDVLVTLVEAYEARHWSIYAPEIQEVRPAQRRGMGRKGRGASSGH